LYYQNKLIRTAENIITSIEEAFMTLVSWTLLLCS